MGDGQVPLLRGTQQSVTGAVTKYITLFKGETTILVTFNIIDPSAVTQDIIENTVASVTLAAAPTLEDKISQLPFSFQSTDPFNVADVLGGSTVLLSTVAGPDPTGLKPIVIITRGQNVVYEDAANISEDLLRGTRGLSLAEILREESVEFAGGMVICSKPVWMKSPFCNIPMCRMMGDIFDCWQRVNTMGLGTYSQWWTLLPHR